jgi:hypothetical protein
MTKWFLMAAAAVGVFAVTATADIGSAFAQSSVTVGPHGVTVRERGYHDRRHHSYRGHHAQRCRVVTHRHRGPHGRVVVRKTRQCY